MKAVAIKTAVFFLFSALAAGESLAVDYAQKTMLRVHDPVQVSGALLTDLLGSRIESLRLYSCRNGAMEPILFQLDERIDDGTFIFNLGERSNLELSNGVLDPQDFLVFRINDTGDQAAPDVWPAKKGIEIKLEDPLDGGVSYCYLFSHRGRNVPAALSENTIELAHWDPWEQSDFPFIVKGMSYTIEGLVNVIGGRHYKTAVNKTFMVPPSAGGTGENILDGQRMRAFGETFFRLIRIKANETNMVGGIDALRQGPLRGCGTQWITVALPLGLEAPRIYSDVFTYDRVIVSTMQLNVPSVFKHIISRAGIEFGYDLNESAYGMRFYSPNCMDGVTIDGHMSKKERLIPDDWVPWYLITGPQGSLIFRVDIDKSLLEQTVPRLTYIDDRGVEFPPEDVPGCIGYQRTTIEINSIKSSRYDFRIDWYFPPNLYKDGGYDEDVLQEFLNIIDNPIIIRVNGNSEINKSLNPPPLRRNG